MAEAKRDENHVPTMIGVSKNDGATVLPIYADAADHRIIVSDGLAGADLGPLNAKKDENRVSTLMAVSAVDGVTPVPLYVDPTDNSLLIRLS